MKIREFIADVKVPMTIESYDKKIAEVDELFKNGQLSKLRAAGMKQQLQAFIDNNAEAELRERFRRSMYEDMCRIDAYSRGLR